MMNLDWDGIAELLDKWPEGMIIGGESDVSIHDADICKVEFVGMKRDGDYYYLITDVLTIDDMVSSMVRMKLMNMLFDIMVEEAESMSSRNPVDYSKEKEAIARVIKMLDDLDKK